MTENLLEDRDYELRAEKIMSRVIELSLCSDVEIGISRIYGTPAYIQGCNKLLEWFKEAGLETWMDHIGNVRGRFNGKEAGLKTLVIGSHIDTVVNAGMFDGPLGIMMGLDIIETLQQTNLPLPFNIELIAFCDEEGVRFHTTYLGSKVVAGKFDESVLEKTDAQGISLRDAIKTVGGNADLLKKDAIAEKDWLGYFEIHIEQGPILYESGIPLAIVSGIAGQYRASILYTGVAGHAGTVPMNMRRDALCCAAESILAIENFAKAHPKVVATIGKIDVLNQASNVIPGNVICSLDLRSESEDDLEMAWTGINSLLNEISLSRNISIEINPIQQALPIKCDYHLNFMLSRAITAAGFNVTQLTSGAGHDAVTIAEVAPVAMMFVKCFKGISHNPLEAVEIKDIASAAKVSDLFIQNLINYHNQE